MNIKSNAVITVKLHQLTKDDVEPVEQTTTEYNSDRENYVTKTQTVQPTSVWLTYKVRKHDGHIGANVSAHGRVVQPDGELGEKVRVDINNKQRPDAIHALVEDFRPKVTAVHEQMAIELGDNVTERPTAEEPIDEDVSVEENDENSTF